jgi:hypothetical protein
LAGSLPQENKARSAALVAFWDAHPPQVSAGLKKFKDMLLNGLAQRICIAGR